MSPTSSPTFLPDDYLPHLDELNRIAASSGVPLEGGLFYFHHQTNPGRMNIYDVFMPKRRNFAAACRTSRRLLEIGLNAGHSALLALACGVEYHGVDICKHAYTQPAADYLKKTFGGRFHFYPGDSLKMLPDLAAAKPALRFDMFHIDGHHGVDFCVADTVNALAMAETEAWLLIDDTDLPDIQSFYREMIDTGSLAAETPPGWEDYFRHKIGRLHCPAD